MSQETLLPAIRKFIAENKTEKALDLLATVSANRIEEELPVLRSQFQRIREELRLNTISREEAEIKINQLHVAILDLIKNQDAPQSAPTTKAAPKKSFDFKWLAVLVIPFLVYSLYQRTHKEGKKEELTTNKVAVPELKKMKFYNAGLKSGITVEMEINDKSITGTLIKTEGYEKEERYPFRSSTPYVPGERICMKFEKFDEDGNPGYTLPTLKLDGSHCWLIGNNMEGEFGLIVPYISRDHELTDYFDADGNRPIVYKDFNMFLEFIEE